MSSVDKSNGGGGRGELSAESKKFIQLQNKPDVPMQSNSPNKFDQRLGGNCILEYSK